MAISTDDGAAATPAIAGIAFDWLKDGTIDITYMGGIIINYAWTGPLALQLELGWDEDEYGFDTWYATLHPSHNYTRLYLPWSEFKQDGYKNKHPLKLLKIQNQLTLELKIAPTMKSKELLPLLILNT